ncbi:MAG TPA: hypothetical protein VMZ53_06070 [Kofleriaceae bacterium]|nr:hypothetical protein [Kofleriaceae bacterium]
MRTLAVGALALLAGGCLEAHATRCANGAICPDGFACTENAETLCGPELLVEACMGRDEFAPCEVHVSGEPAVGPGACHAGVCDACTEDFAGCHFAQWTAMRSPTTENLYTVFAASDSDVDAAGDNGTFLHYDGKAWSRSESYKQLVGAEDAETIWRDATSELVLVTKGDIYRKRIDGSWELAVSTGSTLSAMWAASPTDVVAAGLAGVIVEYNGTTATPVTPAPIPSFVYRGVWVSSTGQAWAVGRQGGVVRRVNGVWSVARAPMSSQPDLRAVWGRADNDVWMVGDVPAVGATEPTILHFDGTTIAPAALPTGTLGPIQLLGLTGTATDVWAASAGSTIEHYDGTTWTQMETSAGASLDAISAAHDIFAVGVGGRIYRFTP